MAVTVKWMLEENQGFHCVTENADITAPITGVHIIDNPDTFGWLKKGEFVLTTGYLFKDDYEKLLQTMKLLKEKGCSGIGIKMKRYLNEIPPEWINEAEKWNIPVVEVPYTLSLAEVSGIIYRGNFNQETESIRGLYEKYTHFSAKIMEEKDNETVINELAGCIGCDVILTDEQWNVRLASEGTDAGLLPSMGELLWEEDTAEKLRDNFTEEKNSVANALIERNGRCAGCTVWKLCAEQEIIGYIVVPEKDKRPDMLACTFIEHVLPLLSFSFYKECVLNKVMKRSGHDMGYDFVNHLLMKKGISEREIEFRCGLYGFDNRKHWICMLIRLRDCESAYEKNSKRIVELLQEINETENYALFTVNYLDCVIVYFMDGEKDNRIQAVKDCRRIMKRVKERSREESISVEIGMSGYQGRTEGIVRAFHQAEEAVAAGKKIRPAENVHFYEDYYLFFLLKRALNKEELEDLYKKTILILDRFDRENHTNFEESLEIYFESSQNIAESAKRMFIHRNTMLYRMEKIRELLKIEKIDGTQSLQLQLGIMAGKIIKEGKE